MHDLEVKFAYILIGLSFLTAVAGGVKAILFYFGHPRKKSIWASFREMIDPWNGVEDPELRPAISKELKQLMLVQYRMVAQGLCVSVTFGTAMRVASMNDQTLFSVIRSAEQTLFSTKQLYLFGMVYFIFSAITCWPRVVTSTSLEVFYAIEMLCLCAFTSPFADSRDIVLTANLARLMMVTANFSKFTFSLSGLFLNMLFFVCSVWSMHSIAKTGVLLFFQLLSLWVPFLMARNMRRAVFHSLQLKDAGEMHSAACALLRSCCEVVVEIDAESRVTDHGKDLCSFLLQEKSQCPEDLCLVDLIVHEEDRRAFLQNLHESKQEGSLAENMLVSVRDALNIQLRLELLWFQFSHKSEKRFMVGLREFSDFQNPKEHRRRPRVPDAEANGPARAGTPEATASRSSTMTSSIPESVSVTSGASSPPAAVLVDATAEGLPIHSITPEFCLRIGRLALGTKLTDHVRQPQAFAQWVQAAVGDIFNGLGPPASYRVTLHMPQGQFLAKCRVLPNMDVALDRVGLVFYHISRKAASAGDLRHWLLNGKGTPSAGRAALQMSI